MRQSLFRFWIAFAVLFSLLAAGCSKSHMDMISHILADPASFSGKDVTVGGKVTRVFDPTAGLIGLSAYQIEDKSGKIWVISRSGAPSVGSEVGVKAKVRQDFNLGSELLGAVLNEEERKTK
jgi:hypothetical protein